MAHLKVLRSNPTGRLTLTEEVVSLVRPIGVTLNSTGVVGRSTKTQIVDHALISKDER